MLTTGQEQQQSKEDVNTGFLVPYTRPLHMWHDFNIKDSFILTSPVSLAG